MGDSGTGIKFGTLVFWVFIFYLFFGGDDDEEKKIKVSDSQETARIEESIPERIENGIKKAEQKINEGFSKLEKGLENSGEKLEEGVKKFEEGVKNLEKKLSGGVDGKESETEERGMTEESTEPQEAEVKEETSITKDEGTSGELEKL